MVKSTRFLTVIAAKQDKLGGCKLPAWEVHTCRQCSAFKSSLYHTQRHCCGRESNSGRQLIAYANILWFLKDFPFGLQGMHLVACINFGITRLCLLLA